MPRVNFQHAKNRAILAFLSDPTRIGKSSTMDECDPSEQTKVYEALGTHPDLLMRLWDELGGMLEVDCRWVVYGSGCLVHPVSGIIFGYASGTHTYALKLPMDLFLQVTSQGARTQHKFQAIKSIGKPEFILDLKTIEPGWVFGDWSKKEELWCKHAFSFAAQ